jgi:trehalose 6-phosphate synthase
MTHFSGATLFVYRHLTVAGSRHIIVNVMSRLVVVTNRVPAADELARLELGSVAVGGLVSAVKSMMLRQRGLWLGWSGRSTSRGRPAAPGATHSAGPVDLVTIDLTEDELNLYYTGFSNRTLWPLLHGFVERVSIRRELYRAYQRINRRFAETLFPMLRHDDLVWVHDYQLFLVGQYLRQAGWKGKLGHFLHVPFPAPEIFDILPWGPEILRGLMYYDQVGVHTADYQQNLARALAAETDGNWDGSIFSRGRDATRIGVYPIGIDPDEFQGPSRFSAPSLSDVLSLPPGPDNKIIVGVDRLDYTKGIPLRLRAFNRMLERHPTMRGKVTFIQISAPSRTRVPEYVKEREDVEMLVGQINGKFSERGWAPIRYLYRFFPQHDLARFYHDADVGMVTPLRDGMNLIAKEFVAAQGEDPGVLVLSRFSGAAVEMVDALIVNPYDIDGTSEALYAALRMPETERIERWRSMMKVVNRTTAEKWGESFVADLERGTEGETE